MHEVVVSYLLALLTLLTAAVGPSRKHGSVVHGVVNDMCDNARWRLWVDWNNSTDIEYRCQLHESVIPVHQTAPRISCLKNEDIPDPIHKCMTERITYADQPPRGGPHRPLWPVYGEYLYVPPQRWVHSLEHGAAVLLYHPCADPLEVNQLRKVATSCLRRHIITPYRHLPLNQPLAIVTYGCKLTMGKVDTVLAKTFVTDSALNPKRASEAGTWRQGQYSFGLIRESHAPPGSNYKDDVICPNNNAGMWTQENMRDNFVPVSFR